MSESFVGIIARNVAALILRFSMMSGVYTCFVVKQHNSELASLDTRLTSLFTSTGAYRNYRVSNGREEHCIAFVTAVFCSDTDEAKQLATFLKLDVFNYKDRHSDDICYLSNCTKLSTMWRSLGWVKFTVAPEQYRLYAPGAANHNEIERPHFVATNKKGDILFTDGEHHIVGMLTRHNPARMSIVCGQWGEKGVPSTPSHGDGLGVKMKLHSPSGLAVLPSINGKEEYCLFADTDNRYVYMHDTIL